MNDWFFGFSMHSKQTKTVLKGNGINLNKTHSRKFIEFMPEAFDSTMSLLPGASL